MFVLGPIGVFFLGHRFARYFMPGLGKRDRVEVHLTTVACIALWVAITLFFGWQALVLLFLPALWIAGMSGVFLFYAQHQIPAPLWRRTADWNFLEACVGGASHLRLNRVLAWFSGDIGVHHLHHLAPRIPNYALRRCLQDNPGLEAHTVLSLWQALSTIRLKLYDEQRGHMVTFRQIRNEPAAITMAAAP
jgi:acyl-lipid omega-6 desaturase (Delta-12 desaturase)